MSNHPPGFCNHGYLYGDGVDAPINQAADGCVDPSFIAQRNRACLARGEWIRRLADLPQGAHLTRELRQMLFDAMSALDGSNGDDRSRLAAALKAFDGSP